MSRRLRGRVSLLGFPAFPLPSGFCQIFGQGLRLHLNPFFVQLFNNLLCVEATLFYPLQRRGEGESGLLYGHGVVSVQCDSGGLSLANSCLISFSWLAVTVMVVSPVIDWACPRFCLLPLAVKRHACPLVFARKP